MSTDNLLPPPYNRWDIRPPWLPPEKENYPYQRMVVLPDGQTVPLLSEKGYSAFNCYKRFLLCSGAKKTTKTISIANRFLRNMWEVDGAVGAIIGHTMSNTKHGTYRDLIKWVLPGWCNADFGMKVIRGPITDNASKKEFIIVRNMHGGESEIQLHSLDYELDVEKKFRSLRFSCIWLAEADLFADRSVFDLLRQQLRLIGVPLARHQFLFDCNPPLEGDEHWLHDVFRKATDPKSKHYLPKHEELFKEYQFGLDDNPFMPEEEKEEIKRSYAHDPVKYARFCKGEWIVDTAGGLFDDTYVHNVHCVGSAESPDKSEWECIVPPEDTPRLLTGTDTGAFNHATSFIVPRMNEEGLWVYDCFDEVCNIGKQVSMDEYAKQVWERVQFWTKWMTDTYKLTEPPLWRHWCDSSLFSYESKSNTNDAQIFMDVSDGHIGMRSPVGQKHRRQVAARVAMMQRLLHAQRFFISAQCHWNISWARFLKPGRAANQTLMPGSIHSHTFSATSYAIGAELPHELKTQYTPTVATGMVCIE